MLNSAGTSAGWLLLLSLVRGVGADLTGRLSVCRVISYRKSSFWSDVKQNMVISTCKRQYYTIHSCEATVSPRGISKHGRNGPFCAHPTLKELDWLFAWLPYLEHPTEAVAPGCSWISKPRTGDTPKGFHRSLGGSAVLCLPARAAREGICVARRTQPSCFLIFPWEASRWKKKY